VDKCLQANIPNVLTSKIRAVVDTNGLPVHFGRIADETLASAMG